MQGAQKSSVQPLLQLLQKRDARSPLRRAISLPGLRALLLVVILFIVYLRYGSTQFYRDPGSVFFDPDFAYEREYSLIREAEAEQYLLLASNVTTKNSSRTLPFAKAARKPSICATVITNLQNVETPYVDAAIATLTDRLTTYEREDLNLKVFFATSEASRHASWNKPWLRTLVDEAYSYKGVVSEEDYKLLSILEREPTNEFKGIIDYVTALKHCYDSTTAPYIAVFEDDIIVAETWLVRVKKAVLDIKTQMEGEERGWLGMRLFNQEASSGWNSRRVGSNNEFRISLGISAVFLAALIAYRRKSHTIRKHLDNWTLAVICLIAIPGIVVMFFQSGRASVMPQRAGVRQEELGSWTKGMVFPREAVPGLIGYLKQREVGRHDFVVRDYARHQKLAKFSLYPTQLQHVGPRSTFQNGSEEDGIWSMAFESFDPIKIEKQHMQLVSQLYHDKIKAGA